MTASSGQHGTSKLPPRQPISNGDQQETTKIQEEKEILKHSPNGGCGLREEKRSKRKEKIATEAEEMTVEAQLEALFRRCFKAAFPEFRVQVATQSSLQLIADLGCEVQAGEWTLAEIEETWSYIFPMWWRFVTDIPVRTYDRTRPDRFCAVTYLSEMYNYLLDHRTIFEKEANLGPLAPGVLRQMVADAYHDIGGIRNLVLRDPDDASRQLLAMAEYFRDARVTTEEGIRFIVRVTSYHGLAGLEGHKYWTPHYENMGLNLRACLAKALESRKDDSIQAYAADCVRQFATRVLSQLDAVDDVNELLGVEMDEATRLATCVSLGNGRGDPIDLFKKEFGLVAKALAD